MGLLDRYIEGDDVNDGLEVVAGVLDLPPYRPPAGPLTQT